MTCAFSLLFRRQVPIIVCVILLLLTTEQELEAESRGAFSSVEEAWQNGFELIAYATTIIWSRPDHFRWPSLISVIAVAAASAAYTTYVYLVRDHLLHSDALTSFLRSKEGKQLEHERGIARITSEPDI